jgi:hypothetical protein
MQLANPFLQLSILVVEPDTLRWQRVRSGLLVRGHEPVSVTNPQDAVSVLSSFDVGLIVINPRGFVHEHVPLIARLAWNPTIEVLLAAVSDAWPTIDAYRNGLGTERAQLVRLDPTAGTWENALQRLVRRAVHHPGYGRRRAQLASAA